jgi:hypothetical protein
MGKKIILLLVMLLLLGTGCGKKEVNEVDEADIIDGNFKDIFSYSILDIFPLEKNYTFYYEGTSNYLRYETIVNIEEISDPKNTKYLYIEGEEEYSEGSKVKDLSFVKKYKITENSMELLVGDYSLILLKSPIEVGNSWTNDWFDERYGFFKAKTTITEVTDNSITTELIPMTPDKDNVYKGYKIITKYQVGKGVVHTKNYYNLSDEGYKNIHEFSVWLYKTSNTAKDGFVSRYVNPALELRPYYKHDDTWYKIIISKSKHWVNSNKNSVTDEEMALKYEEILKGLMLDDLKSISTAKTIAQYFCTHMNNPDIILPLFEGFYEEVIAHNRIEDNYLIYEEIEKLFRYDLDMGMHKMVPIDSINDPILKAKAVILYENGISVGFTEGMPFFCEDAEYINKNFSNLVSDRMKDYLLLKRWEYKNTPLFNDGGLMVSWSELGRHIIDLEKYYNKYPGTEEAKWARTKADMLFEIYIMPVPHLVNTQLYWNGVLGKDAEESYKELITQYPESEYSSIVKDVYSILEKSGFMYSKELDDFLKDKGYNPYLTEFLSGRIEQLRMQIEDFNRIISNKIEISDTTDESLEIVTVDNVEDLLGSIKSNRKIILKDGNYILPYEFESDTIKVEYGQVIFINVNNLVIQGEGDLPVNIVSESYDYVFIFDKCNNITLTNLKIGHLAQYCIQGVIAFKNSNKISIDRSIIFGCGEWGIETDKVEEMKVTNTLISDCSTDALRLNNSKNLFFANCIFTRNAKNVVRMEGTDNVIFKNVEIVSNQKEGYNNVPAIFELNKCTNIILDSCTIKDNKTEKLIDGDSQLSIIE